MPAPTLSYLALHCPLPIPFSQGITRRLGDLALRAPLPDPTTLHPGTLFSCPWASADADSSALLPSNTAGGYFFQ